MLSFRLGLLWLLSLFAGFLILASLLFIANVVGGGLWYDGEIMPPSAIATLSD